MIKIIPHDRACRTAKKNVDLVFYQIECTKRAMRSNRQQRIVHNNHFHQWKGVNKGTTQGSVSGSYLYDVFMNDLEIKQGSTPALFTYADDSTIVATVWKGGRDTSSALVEQFLTWENCNSMKCSPNKFKELVTKNKGDSTTCPAV